MALRVGYPSTKASFQKAVHALLLFSSCAGTQTADLPGARDLLLGLLVSEELRCE